MPKRVTIVFLLALFYQLNVLGPASHLTRLSQVCRLAFLHWTSVFERYSGNYQPWSDSLRRRLTVPMSCWKFLSLNQTFEVKPDYWSEYCLGYQGVLRTLSEALESRPSADLNWSFQLDVDDQIDSTQTQGGLDHSSVCFSLDSFNVKTLMVFSSSFCSLQDQFLSLKMLLRVICFANRSTITPI